MSDQSIVNDILAHYGVKGMRWGVRRSENDRENISKMSDDELKAVVGRMQLERQYRSLSNESKKTAGRAFVAKYGNQAISMVVSAAVGLIVKQALNSAWPNKKPSTKGFARGTR